MSKKKKKDTKKINRHGSCAQGSLLLGMSIVLAVSGIIMLYYVRWSSFFLQHIRSRSASLMHTSHLHSLYDFLHCDISASKKGQCTLYGNEEHYLLCPQEQGDVGWEQCADGCVRVEGIFDIKKGQWKQKKSTLYFHDQVSIAFTIKKISQQENMVYGTISKGKTTVQVMCAPKGCNYEK
ncbi:MAG TPA: hypothetical protein VEK38_04645 [Candidatus Bathyarchaeia archaeon]|nr:hypothetical protein [Candidatus Bathyarchaeia archaeon]